MRIVAVDIGGTMIKSGLWNGETFVELRETETCASEGGAALMERVKGLIHSYHDFEAIGDQHCRGSEYGRWKHFLREQQYSGIHRHAGKADHGRGILCACRSGE